LLIGPYKTLLRILAVSQQYTVNCMYVKLLWLQIISYIYEKQRISKNHRCATRQKNACSYLC